ncbi:ABC transporter permease [Mangrovimonas sp. YM274]|uniref:ABC transporter permease n=1 Tax=Mangrovimonas sp. YM274 TaxID=3070660 RepID=UPI0027DCD481|nr:ABC transporter permease [Mangrovimonas sp. YM274]WMI69467.1 ABC transporter permease [Mangrovimonas sp. YM274]
MEEVFKALEISQFLPHRPPFLMVDYILSIGDDHVSTSFEIKPDNIFIEQGRFNEAGMVEHAAQTCSAIVGKSYYTRQGEEVLQEKKLIGFISAIKKVTIIECPKVGEIITSQATLKSRFDSDDYSICTFECKVRQEEKELLSCEMNLFIQERK